MPLSSTQLGCLVDQHWGTLCAWLGPSNGQADDIVQEAFIKLTAQASHERPMIDSEENMPTDSYAEIPTQTANCVAIFARRV